MQAPALPASFLEAPIAHRGLHDMAEGRPENSLGAFTAATALGYGIELDLQLSKDGEAIVFHDYFLDRLTSEKGPLAQRTAEELCGISLLHSRADRIPTLAQVLAVVAGRVPLLIELKDQDGELGENIGKLEAATVKALQGYSGDVALMSFNPHSVAELARLAPTLSRGLTTCDYLKQDWPTVPEARLAELRLLPDATRVGSGFVSHQADDLNNPQVTKLRAQGLPVLCWTIRSPEQEATVRKAADNITFEGYLPASADLSESR
ncbi:phosphodiesterase [Lentibacter algarum]|uniref:glycerophosphodiester phosphodiesterase family protein n=1 Tax=Lentibacter algarum TaxID=576131 RepID=UPI001C08827A|nr:glycerophosphodiester phosphodiesterase family protein [Lentibacter algarum]MBU2983021.1 phosphodiesterase [Lentibacter algarum]